MLDPESEASASLPLSDEERVDRLCDQFEAVYRNGQQPRIEDYLGQAPDVARDRLLGELIALEMEWQRQAGTLPDIEAYRERFPNRLAVIEAARELADSQRVDSTTGPHREHDTDLESDTDDGQIPERIGRYAVEKELGRGGFAVVYLAHDTELDCQVALKVARPDRIISERDIERFVEEARNAAGLDHRGIVRVHDVQREANSVYIVQQYVQGQDLAAFAKNQRFSPREIAQLMLDIAEAVGSAHQAGLFHRDLKSANILIDEDGHPHVADFGLAVHYSRQHKHRGELAGSYPYMAPEQVRGEAHRLDGRTDIWAMGVILYELLTRTRPFHGQNLVQLFDEIQYRDPRPPRQIDPNVPSELSRIGLACLAKRATDRYQSTTDLIEDLQHWLDADAEQDAEQPVRMQPKIVPKSLRSFDAGDADFFLELLPGPRDRYGLPKSIRFWKTRIEETDPEQTFGVGLIYGPSGCGKSSLVQAGLLPLLADHIVPVYVEATAADTEVRLLKSLRRRCPDLPEEAALVELLTTLRNHGTAGGKKVLIVLDQFEQWLHAHTADDPTQLVDALRHCDGRNVQALVLARDDFYRGVNRFFQALEERLLEGHNEALVDLFDPDHAKKVLTAFGQAYGKLPETEPTHQQTAFLDTAVAGLAERGEVISVRLAVFAEMMKGKPWTQASLREAGGTEGVGVTFLEETFAARTAPPNYRLHGKGVRAVLQALLPELGTEIKGQMVPYEQLLNVCGYADRPADFDALLAILDKEVRLITPTEPDESGGEVGQPAEQSAKHYQLSHDYLVPSLRRWLRQKETESYSGRARLRLADRAALWQSKPQNQQLPAWWEYLDILALTRKRDWTEAQRRMMSAAHGYYMSRAAALIVLVALLVWGGREMFARVNSDALVNSLVKAGEDKVLETANDLQPYLPWAGDRLQELATLEPKTPDERRQQLHARLALVATDDTQVAALLESLLTASPKYVGVIRDALYPYRSQIAEDMWRELQIENSSVDRRFRAGMALADYQSGSEAWREDDYRFMAEQLLLENPKDQPVWLGYVHALSKNCLPYWEQLFSDENSSETQHLGAANALAEFAEDEKDWIARALTIANPRQHDILFPLLAASPDESVLNGLTKTAAELPPEDLSSVDRLPFGRRRAGAGIMLLRLGERESVLPTFEMTDDPEALTQFIHRCRDRGVSAEELLELLALVTRRVSEGPLCADRSLADASGYDSSRTRYALLLALGEYSLSEIPDAQRDQLLPDLADWYASDPSSSVHGASGWLLRQWGQDEIVQEVDRTPVPYSPDREWFTLAITVTSPRRVYASETAEDGDQATEEAQSPDGQSAESAEGSTNETSDNDEQTTSSDEPPANNEEHGEDAPAGNTERPNDAEDGSEEAEQTEQEPDFVPQTFYFTFIVFPAAEYQIGSVADEPDRDNDEARHAVKITRPFALLDRELTFAELIAFDRQYEGFMQQFERNPIDAALGPNWYDAVAFCHWLTEQAGFSEEDQAYPAPDSLDEKEYPREPNPTANWAPRNWPVRLDRSGFRLPTEAEWEVACRQGTRTMYGQGADAGLLRYYARFEENSDKHVNPPKTRRPTLRGLFDLHGNLWEWCHDWYEEWYASYGSESAADGTDPRNIPARVYRGGGWDFGAAGCRSSIRAYVDPSSRFDYLGFRLALVPSSKDAERENQERAEAIDPSQAEPDGS